MVLPDASLEEAAELMLRWEVGALPVVAGDAYLIGIITYSDLLREFVARGKETGKKAERSTMSVELNGRPKRPSYRRSGGSRCASTSISDCRAVAETQQNG